MGWGKPFSKGGWARSVLTIGAVVGAAVLTGGAALGALGVAGGAGTLTGTLATAGTSIASGITISGLASAASLATAGIGLLGGKAQVAPQPITMYPTDAPDSTDSTQPVTDTNRGNTTQLMAESVAASRAVGLAATQGRASTILTGSQGLGTTSSATNLAKKKLLGA